MAQYEFVLLGAGSDVAYRYVFPALAELEAANLLPRRFRIVAISRKNWTDIRRRIVEGVKTHRGNIGIGVVKKLLARVRHASADLTDPHQLKAVIGRLRGPLVLYFGLPPSISEIIVDYLHEIRLPPRSRVMMEKPFGQNRQSAEALNRKLLRFLSERVLRPTISLDTPLGHTALSLNGGVYGEIQDGARPVFLAEEDGGRVARVTRRRSGSGLA